MSGGEAECVGGVCSFADLVLFVDRAPTPTVLNLTLAFEAVEAAGVPPDQGLLAHSAAPRLSALVAVEPARRPPSAKRDRLGTVARAVVLATVVTNLAAAAVCLAWLRRYAARLIVQISQPSMLALCVLGTVCATLSNLADGGLPRGPTNARCRAMVDLYGVGAVLTTGALYTQMATMERVVEAALSFRRLSRRDVLYSVRSLGVMGLMWTGEVVLLVAWKLDHPLSATTQCSTTTSSKENTAAAAFEDDDAAASDAACLETVRKCTSPTAGVYVPLLAAWHLGCYGLVLHMCYYCRNLPSVALERHSVFAAAFSQLQLNVVAGLVLLTLRDAPHAFLVVRVLANWLGNLATLGLVFGGKMRLVAKYHDFDYRLVAGYIQKSLADSTQRDHVYEMLAVSNNPLYDAADRHRRVSDPPPQQELVGIARRRTVFFAPRGGGRPPRPGAPAATWRSRLGLWSPSSRSVDHRAARPECEFADGLPSSMTSPLSPTASDAATTKGDAAASSAQPAPPPPPGRVIVTRSLDGSARSPGSARSGSARSCGSGHSSIGGPSFTGSVLSETASQCSSDDDDDDDDSDGEDDEGIVELRPFSPSPDLDPAPSSGVLPPPPPRAGAADRARPKSPASSSASSSRSAAAPGLPPASSFSSPFTVFDRRL